MVKGGGGGGGEVLSPRKCTTRDRYMTGGGVTLSERDHLRGRRMTVGRGGGGRVEGALT